MAAMNELDAALTGLSEHSKGILEAVQAIREILSSQAAEEAAAEAAPAKARTSDGVMNPPVIRFSCMYASSPAGFLTVS